MNTRKLVDAEQLRAELFAETRRPTIRLVLRWARTKVIPSYKIGHRVWFLVEECRESLERRNKIKARA